MDFVLVDFKIPQTGGSQNLPLPLRIYPPPLYCDNVKCIWLPESARQSQNKPPFSTTICDPPSIYPSQNLHPLPLRIYLAQSLLPFLQLYANFLESTPQSLNMPPFCRNYVYIVGNLPLAPRTEQYSGIA